MLPASMAPSAPPAPTMVCISSIKRITLPSSFARALSTAFNLSSNSPLYFAPAINAPMSRDSSLLFFRPSGTSPFTIRCASPSTMAVLPTPGSPIRTGLFLVLRCSTCMALLISSSLPITGSSLPLSALAVRSMVYFSRARRLDSTSASFTFSPPRTLFMASSSFPLLMPHLVKTSLTRESSVKAALTKSSDEINLSWYSFASLSL